MSVRYLFVTLLSLFALNAAAQGRELPDFTAH